MRTPTRTAASRTGRPGRILWSGRPPRHPRQEEARPRLALVLVLSTPCSPSACPYHKAVRQRTTGYASAVPPGFYL